VPDLTDHHDDDVWGRAVQLGAAGQYADAFGLLDAAAPAADPDAASLRHSLRASLRRQLGDHVGAEPLDEAAVALAVGPVARADATIGLAADAIGLNRPAVVTARLVAAEDPVTRAGTRAAIRLSWVRAEAALLVDDAEGAWRHADEALRRCPPGAERHRTKSLLVRGVAAVVAGRPVDGEPDLLEAWRAAVRAGWPPLAWPAAAVLAGLPDPSSDGLHELLWRPRAVAAVQRLAAGLGPADRTRWLADPAVRAAQGLPPGARP
jgi:hypothetical protein